MRDLQVKKLAAEHKIGTTCPVMPEGWYRCRLANAEHHDNARGGRGWKVALTLIDMGNQTCRTYINFVVPPRSRSEDDVRKARLSEHIGDKEQAAIADACGWDERKTFNAGRDLPRLIGFDLDAYLVEEPPNGTYAATMRPTQYRAPSKENLVTARPDGSGERPDAVIGEQGWVDPPEANEPGATQPRWPGVTEPQGGGSSADAYAAASGARRGGPPTEHDDFSDPIPFAYRATTELRP